MEDLDAPRSPFAPGDDIVSILRSHARTAPDRTALIEGDTRVTRAELAVRVDRVASAFASSGTVTGDRVALLGKNTIPYVEAFLGALAAGLTVVPLPTLASADSLALMLADASPTHVFISAEYEQPITEAISRVPTFSGRLVGLDFGSERVATVDVFESEGAGVPEVVIGGSDHFDVMYSSGTTGTPKGIVHSHAVRKASYRGSRARYFDERTINVVATPFYSNTTCVTWLLATAAGGVNVLMSKFDAESFLHLVERHHATHAMLVPVQHERILRAESLPRRDTSSLSYLFSTSAPLRAATKREILERFSAELIEIYGLTEGGVVTTLTAREHPDKLASVGAPAPGCEVKVLDDAGQELPSGRAGEIVGRSTSIMCGYLNRPEATAELVWRDADDRLFLRSGDIGRIDEDGFLHLLDRKKDVIISGGFNVYAADLEAVLLGHEAVREVAVIGVPSSQWGETPMALVVLEPGASIDPDKLQSWCNERLGKTHRVSRIEFREELPKNAIGKVLKRELREPYWRASP